MRVLAVSNLYPPRILGGYELGCAQVAEDLRRRGHCVRVVTSSYSTIEQSASLAGRLQLQPIYMEDLVRWMPEGSRRQLFLAGRMCSSLNIEVLIDELRQFRPDVVYFWNVIGVGGLGLLATAELLGVPWVMHLMDNVPTTLCSGDAGPIKPLTDLWAKVFTEGRYISLSRQLVAELVSEGIELGDVTYIPNWVIAADYRHDRFGPGGSKRNALWSQQDRGRRPLNAIFSGVVSPVKGAHLVLDIVEELKRRDVAFHVTMLGRHEIETIESDIHRRGLADRIRAPGAVQRHEVIAALEQSDLLLFPTWEREPFGFAIIEAAAAGCPPLFTERCGAGEYLVDGVHGLKAARSADAFADVVERIWKGEIALEPIGRAAQHFVRSELEIERLGRSIEAVLEGARRPYQIDSDAIDRVRHLSAYAEQILIPTACF